jgi:hypothetical protein
MYYKSKTVNFLNVQSRPKSKREQVLESERIDKKQKSHGMKKKNILSARYNTKLFTQILPIIIILLKIFLHEFC